MAAARDGEGTARIEASPESLAARAVRAALAVFLREWGM